jgi:uncharacterized protein YkwD
VDPKPACFVAVAALWLGCADVSGDSERGSRAGERGDDAVEPAELAGTTAAHNDVRAAHGVPPLIWDEELAATARQWAEQCIDSEAPAGLVDHNEDRSEGYPVYVGENIFGSTAATTGVAAVDAWAAEEADYDYDSNTCSGVCGHYTQVVWAATTHVGCGIADCSGLTFGHTVVCNYAPGGNDGSRPY